MIFTCSQLHSQQITRNFHRRDHPTQNTIQNNCGYNFGWSVNITIKGYEYHLFKKSCKIWKPAKVQRQKESRLKIRGFVDVFLSRLRRFRQGPSFPFRFFSQIAMLQKKSVQCCRRIKHETYFLLMIHILITYDIESVNYYRTCT